MGYLFLTKLVENEFKRDWLSQMLSSCMPSALEFKVLEIRYVSIKAYLVDTLVVSSKISFKCPPRSEDYFFVLKNWKTMAQLTLTSSLTPLHLCGFWSIYAQVGKFCIS